MIEWVVVTEPGKFDLVEALSKQDEIDCRQNVFIDEGDIIYLYVGGQVKSIKFKCQAVKMGIPEAEKGENAFGPESDADNRENYPCYMRLKKLAVYEDGQLPLEGLLANGLPNVTGTTRVRSKLGEYIHSV
ncbi:MAG: hypothetical protein IJ072_05125 [Oscillospiraceae bacterium]|nr:hypothetical protein [Oscillospiraceae bacterium]